MSNTRGAKARAAKAAAAPAHDHASHDHDHECGEDCGHDHSHDHEPGHVHGFPDARGIYLISPSSAVRDPQTVELARERLAAQGFKTALD
ncbi:MAG: LD-carboxypeptidase, partial [Achromobacter xylosoxidans]|nr:LD-carboxypeptidase [Achromobacter xylosoxidans]